MTGTISLQQKNISSTTQTLEKDEVLEYTPRQENFFENIPSEFSNSFITGWEFTFSRRIQPISQEVLLKKENVKPIDWRTEKIRIIRQAKQWHKLHKEEILKRYKGKYISVILNPQKGLDTSLEEAIVDVAKDFYQLATKVYKKYGYKTIYMPFISRRAPMRINVPTPLWLKRK